MIKVIATSNKDDFETQVNELLSKNYKIITANCGFVDSVQYDFCDYYQAIMQSLTKEELHKLYPPIVIPQ